MIRELWKHKISFDWILGLWLIAIFSSTRFFAVLYGIQTGDNKYLSILFSIMIILPFILLTKKGRLKAKIKKPISIFSLLKSFALGSGICVCIFLIGEFLYSNELLNWFRYIGECYPVDFESITNADKKIYFLIFLMIGMTFSPFGEELLYRGLIHSSFQEKFGENKAAIIDSLAFSLVHLSHYGLIYSNNAWEFQLLPSILWTMLMFATGLLFNYCRRTSDSIWGAIISHIAFNVTMTYIIFYLIF